MSAFDQAEVSNLLNATLPTATGGKPASFTNMATASAMKLRLDATAPTAAAAGTELSGTGYTAGGTALGQSTASSAGSAVTIPASTTSWTNGSGSSWTVNGADVMDSSATRSWFGTLNGAPVSVANGNTIQFAANAITVSDT